MDISTVKEVLLYCLLFNFAILLIWTFTMLFARDWLYRFQSQWFNIPEEKFDSLNYVVVGLFKILWIIFNLAPYIALQIVT